MPTCTAFAPASIGNMIAGFDVLGFALESPGDTVTLTTLDDGPSGVMMGDVGFAEHVQGRAALVGKLSTDVARNIAGYVVREVWNACKPTERPHAVRVDLLKGCGIGTGLGSSAASAAAASFAALTLLNTPTPGALLEYGLRGESLASGARHADNLAPSLFGGVIGVRSLDPIDVYPIAHPPSLVCAVFQPQLSILTKDARSALPDAVPLAQYVKQSATLASLVAGLFAGDLERIGASLSDIIAEPARAKRIPAFAELKQDALDLGALGAGIAGSGPTIFALCNDEHIAESTLVAWRRRYDALGIETNAFTSCIGAQGARLL